MQKGYYKAELILLVVTLIAAAGWIFSNEALAGFKPLTLMGSRSLLAGLGRIVCCLVARKPHVFDSGGRLYSNSCCGLDHPIACTDCPATRALTRWPFQSSAR